MKRIVAGRFLVEVFAHASTVEAEARAEETLTRFLMPAKPWDQLAYGFTIHVLDRARPHPEPFDEIRRTSPDILQIRDGTTEFWCDTKRRLGVAIYDDTQNLDGRQIAKPFRWLFSVLLDALEQGVMLPHASALALGYAAGAALLVGPSGSGKSSVAGAWLREELIVVGDDRVPVWNDGSHFVVGPLYTAFCLDQAMGTRLGLGGDAVEQPKVTSVVQNGKVVYELPPVNPTFHAIGAIIRPRVDRAWGIALRPLSKGDTLMALLPSSLVTSIGISKDVIAGLTELVESVPCYELVVGSMLEKAPGLIASLLRGQRQDWSARD